MLTWLEKEIQSNIIWSSLPLETCCALESLRKPLTVPTPAWPQSPHLIWPLPGLCSLPHSSSLHLVTGASFCSWSTPCSLLPWGLCIFWLPLPGFFPSWTVYLDPSGSSKRSHHTFLIFPSPKVLHEDNLLYALLGLSWEFPWGSVSSVQSQSRVRLFATLWTAAHQASLSITDSRSLLKLMSIELVMPSNHPTLCCHLLFLPSIFPSIRVFSNEPDNSVVKNCLQYRKPSFDPYVGKIPWSRKWQPTPIFLPGEFHRQRTLAGSP